jgi:alanine racemase
MAGPEIGAGVQDTEEEMSSHESNPDELLSVLMSRGAAERFRRALVYAEGLVHNQAEASNAPDTRAKVDEHGEWLRWGCSRIDYADRTAREAERCHAIATLASDTRRPR